MKSAQATVADLPYATWLLFAPSEHEALHAAGFVSGEKVVVIEQAALAALHAQVEQLVRDAPPAAQVERWKKLEEEQRGLRMRYAGVLALLCEGSVHLGGSEADDLRDSIERALIDACADGRLRWRRTINRFEIEAAGEAES